MSDNGTLFLSYMEKKSTEPSLSMKNIINKNQRDRCGSLEFVYEKVVGDNLHPNRPIYNTFTSGMVHRNRISLLTLVAEYSIVQLAS